MKKATQQDWNRFKEWLLNLDDKQYCFDKGNGFTGGYALRIRSKDYPDDAQGSLKDHQYHQMIENLVARLQGKEDVYPMPEPEKFKQELQVPNTMFDFNINVNSPEDIILDVNHSFSGGRHQLFMENYYQQQFPSEISRSLYRQHFKKNRLGFANMAAFADFDSALEIFSEGTDYSMIDKNSGILFFCIVNRLAHFQYRLTDELLKQNFKEHMSNSSNAHLIPKESLLSGLIRLSHNTSEVLFDCLQEKMVTHDDLFDIPSNPVANSNLNVYGLMKAYQFETPSNVEKFFEEIGPYLRINQPKMKLQSLDIHFYGKNKHQAIITAISENSSPPDMELVKYCLLDFLKIKNSIKYTEDDDMVKYFNEHPDYVSKLVLKYRLEKDVLENNNQPNSDTEMKKGYKI
jgi:hypothetical protein